MDKPLSQEGIVYVLWLQVQSLMDFHPNPSFKLLSIFGLDSTERE